ncbi:jg13783 [Pararge aegeria aegeria]|uniref:Hyaluronidase n=2 Tax=Pararge aegeria TaxID=116150 RepID=A0A8S4SAJ8_9NEOP|nr:jg13783 [Pararge aegeria aegeria]
MPEAEVPRDYNTPFKVYWNVPTRQCVSRNVIFDNLEKFGIIQNQNDTFDGGRITIMYDPGLFPAIFKADSGKYRYRNGGVPQQGNLELHLTAFRESLNKSIPNPDFNGVGIIDFESWRPIFRQQFGTLTPYIDLSMNIEKRRHWWWPASWQKMEATKRFEDAARVFMQTTLSIAKQMRPRAIWGYYAFPYCFNIANNNVENCSDIIKGENDKIYWLWAESTALYPSVYSSANLSTSQLGALVRGRITEANRVKKAGTLVLPYFWFRYRDAGFMSETDVIEVLEALKTTKASGLIIWGSSNDVSQDDKCNELYNYVENTLGPIIKRYIQQINRIFDETKQVDVENYDDEDNNTVVSTTDTTTTVQTTLKETAETTTIGALQIKMDLGFAVLPQSNIIENISHSEMSNDNKTDNSNMNSITHNEKSFWDIVTNPFNFEKVNNKHTVRSVQNIENSKGLENNILNLYTEKAEIFDMTSNEKNSISMDVSTTEMIVTENVINEVLDTKSDEFVMIVENTNYFNHATTESIANLNLNDIEDDFISAAENLTPSDAFTITSTDSSENFIIISDDIKNELVTSAINLT